MCQKIQLLLSSTAHNRRSATPPHNARRQTQQQRTFKHGTQLLLVYHLCLVVARGAALRVSKQFSGQSSERGEERACRARAESRDAARAPLSDATARSCRRPPCTPDTPIASRAPPLITHRDRQTCRAQRTNHPTDCGPNCEWRVRAVRLLVWLVGWSSARWCCVCVRVVRAKAVGAPHAARLARCDLKIGRQKI